MHAPMRPCRDRQPGRRRAVSLLILCLGAALGAQAQPTSLPTSAPVDSLAQRLAACTFCHGEQGRAGPDGYYPRLAGKPEGYLYNQLLNFREGRRQYRPMTVLIQHQTDDYLRDMARHFAEQQVPYPAPIPTPLTAAQQARAVQLVTVGDAQRQVPACVACHGEALMGALPATPALLGLPRDYLNAQMGAWRNGLRQAHAPDCMGEIARRLAPDDIATLSAWLSSQPAPTLAPLPASPSPLPLSCGHSG